MYWSKAIFFSILALIAATAGAQVHRCKDATGKTGLLRSPVHRWTNW